MPHYMVRWQPKDASAKTFVENPQDCTVPAKALIEGFGSKMLCYYFALGDYDELAICEFSDNISAAACSMRVAATGAFAQFETTVLITAKEAEAAMKKAKRAKTGYTPPND